MVAKLSTDGSRSVTHLPKVVPPVLNVIQESFIGGAGTLFERGRALQSLGGLAQPHPSLQLTDDAGPQGCLGEASEGQVTSGQKHTEQHPRPPCNRAHLAAEVLQKHKCVLNTPFNPLAGHSTKMENCFSLQNHFKMSELAPQFIPECRQQLCECISAKQLLLLGT